MSGLPVYEQEAVKLLAERAALHHAECVVLRDRFERLAVALAVTKEGLAALVRRIEAAR